MVLDLKVRSGGQDGRTGSFARDAGAFDGNGVKV